MEIEQFKTDELLNILFISIVSVIFMFGVLYFFFRFARKKIIEKELEKSALKLINQKKILEATIETQERERKRIAQDLHDAISAKLNVVSLHTNMLLDGSLAKEEQDQALGNILGITTKVLKSSRDIAHNLLPPILDKFGLVAALDELTEEFSTTKKVVVEKELQYGKSLAKNEELHVFRIVQELLNNAMRHGKATAVKVSIIDKEEQMILVFSDNGNGFEVRSGLKQTGLGLKNIKSRLAILNGDLFIDSKPGKGAVFNITITHKKDDK